MPTKTLQAWAPKGSDPVLFAVELPPLVTEINRLMYWELMLLKVAAMLVPRDANELLETMVADPGWDSPGWLETLESPKDRATYLLSLDPVKEALMPTIAAQTWPVTPRGPGPEVTLDLEAFLSRVIPREPA